ncbi:hypothetical protein CVT26_000107 [Gymnopilus dilepis]|uniref:Uncharacterized protein n=1 Tax=Gymnopilus dilepis TaxID=231916 RepID=A0A409VGT3_9AGAR|nr:hypothetical protein CVT26_000107 [Gymnopilus dilepis]
MSSSRFRQLAPSSLLAQFLSQHDDSLRHGFITRIDRSPVSRKRLAFLKALFLNILILLFTTTFAAVTIVRDLMSPLPASMKLASCITQDVLIASAIFVLVRSTIIPFFFDECRLRILYGFRPSEIVIRRPPSIMPLTSNKEVSEDQRLERYWRVATRAVNPELLYSNASAILSSDYWTLEYRAIFDAMRCLEEDQFKEEDLEFSIWKQEDGVWSVCELWRMHEIMTDQQEVAMFKVYYYSYPSPSIRAFNLASQAFLTQSGKEELLAIWQDMLSCSPSGKYIERSPSPKAYQAMVDKFAREGLDYETVWSHVSTTNQSS